MNTRVLIRALAASLTLVALGAPALAADPAAAATGPSKAMREKMAVLHEQMAACLRSDKSMAECRSEMMKSCQHEIGKKSCPMMGMGGGMMGRGGMGRGMQGPMMPANPSSAESPK